MFKRHRRNRKNPAIRALLKETTLLPKDLVVPFFVKDKIKGKEAIDFFPGIFRHSIDSLIKEASILHQKGIQAVILFPWIDPSLKNEKASQALCDNDIIPLAVRRLKKEIPSLLVITDIALDPYTDHGHDGLVGKNQEVLNDATLKVLADMALNHAASGADIVAPSDMMDGRVKVIREVLDKHQFEGVNIMAYSAKYASSLYGPFREALGSGLKFGDKKTYQLDPANTEEALLEALTDEEEGADMLLVKPATLYLDILHQIKKNTHLPVGAYHISGEYAMVMAAHERGMLHAPDVFFETLLSIKRAGADFIITYAADQVFERM